MPKVRCHMCGGRGSHQITGTEPCSKCAGTGRDISSDLWAETCTKCNGSREQVYLRKDICRPCNGTGMADY